MSGESADTSPFTALVVDDSSTVRKQVELELKLLGIQTDTAESGEDAFGLLAQKDYDIIFLDVILPGVDGYQICKTIKKDKARKKTPIIMLTSKSSPFDRVKGALAGCDTYLTKPAKQNSFQKVVKKYLKTP
ncbi:MAG: response regulator [Gammaproteobacteria bacterium]|nr:response regulator [Gammaproteobacteria bacterium]